VYADCFEGEQDFISVVFTNAMGDAGIAQKLPEKRSRTLAQSYEVRNSS
jgi:hypothetical protein